MIEIVKLENIPNISLQDHLIDVRYNVHCIGNIIFEFVTVMQ